MTVNGSRIDGAGEVTSGSYGGAVTIFVRVQRPSRRVPGHADLHVEHGRHQRQVIALPQRLTTGFTNATGLTTLPIT
ncbi:hypothetical protein ACFHYQ_08795 [Sphaerimonospora cavernae]|uniref:Uncharacterized protein n=1 Tax=Sphaerimonospora cavernae TaxID=1740611 RepID=A0ABV6U1S5_9ACTN